MEKHETRAGWRMLLAGLVLATGCATGRPPGAWSSPRLSYRPLLPASAPRAPLAEETPAKAPAQAQAKAPTKARAKPATAKAKATREDVLKVARGLVGKQQVKVEGRRWRDDCTGLVEAVYAQAGVSFSGSARKGDNGVTALYRYTRQHGHVYTQGKPHPGDLVFFRETYDQNRDGRRNDGLTHVGLVDTVDEDGTVTVIHRVRRGVVRYRMNLAKKDLRRDARTGERLNDMLRTPGPGHSLVLTGQLFAAYGAVLPEPSPGSVARR